jgi:hypothetical protein
MPPLRSTFFAAQRFRNLVFQSGCALAVVGFSVAFARQANLNGDNAAHFELARDIWNGLPLFWSAQDANRLFPDELIALLGYALPNGHSYLIWVSYFCSLLALLIYLSLIAFVSALAQSREQRRTLCLLMWTSLAALFTFQTYWPIWVLLPGFHGGGLPICLFALALILPVAAGINGLGAGRLLAFLVLVSLVVAANRYLLIVFVLPLLGAMGIEAVRVLAGSARESTTTTDFRLNIMTTAATVAATGILGMGLWCALANFSWTARITGGRYPDFPGSHYARWISERISKEIFEISTLSSDRATIVSAIAFLVVTSLMACWSVRYPHSDDSAQQRLYRIFSLFVAFSAAGGLAFVLIMVDDQGPWHYRYLTIPVMFSFIWMIWRCWLRSGERTRRMLRAGCYAMIVCIAGIIVYRVPQAPEGAREIAFREGIGRLESRLTTRSRSGLLRGFSNYWIANEVTARSHQIRISIMEDSALRYRFYLNNADELCANDFFFILVDRAHNEPSYDLIVSAYGPPTSAESIDLGRYPQVDILYYEPPVLDRAILAPARIAARDMFPNLRCGERRPD